MDESSTVELVKGRCLYPGDSPVADVLKCGNMRVIVTESGKRRVITKSALKTKLLYPAIKESYEPARHPKN
jgi:hypothetical protein